MATAASLLLLLSFTISPFVQQALTINEPHAKVTPSVLHILSHGQYANCTQPVPNAASETVFPVRWRWLVLPSVIVCLVVLLFIVTMIRTRNECIWKSSTLALVALGAQMERSSRGLPRTVRLAECHLEEVAGIAKELKVLIGADGQWHVVSDS